MNKISALGRQQSGATLLVVMVIILLVSLLALFSARETLLQEKMAQAILTQNQTLQAAEAGLAQAEHWLLAKNKQPEFKVITADYGSKAMIEACEAGICAMSVPSSGSDHDHFWARADFWEHCVKNKQCVEGDEVGKWKIKPRYVIEDYGYSNNNAPRDLMARNPLQEPGTKLMRITAWAELAGSHSITQAIIQR